MRQERWAFSESELASPKGLNSFDELTATIPDPDDNRGVIVYRNGEVSNRYADGTAGLDPELVVLADGIEELYHPDTDESTDRWADVEVDEKDNFVRFLEPVT